jgi:hypothetical protein
MRIWKFRIHTFIIHAIAIVVVMLLGGSLIYSLWLEEWSFLTAFYFCATTITTLGFGDLTPTNDGSRLFTV